MGKRSGVPDTNEAILALSAAELERELRRAKSMAPHLGPLPRKAILKHIHRLEKARSEVVKPALDHSGR